MDSALMGYAVVAALVIPIGVYAACLFVMAVDPVTGRDGHVRQERFESSYQPMRILIAQQAQTIRAQQMADAVEPLPITRAAA